MNVFDREVQTDERLSRVQIAYGSPRTLGKKFAGDKSAVLDR